MKHIVYLKKLSWIIGALLFLASCRKETILTYSTADNIYFNYIRLNNQQDSLNLTFAYAKQELMDSTIMVPVKVTGAGNAKDRSYVIEVDPASTAKPGIHFEIPAEYIVRAGMLVDSIPVRLIRAADLQDTVKTIVLMLKPNDQFHTDIKSLRTVTSSNGDSVRVLTFKINISDILPPWRAAFDTYFGNFSLKKIQLINEITGMPLDYSDSYIYDLNGTAKLNYFAITMSRYLADEAASGNAIYEEDGITPMTMGITYQ